MSDRICQEFFCTISGGGCGGYFLANINIKIDGVVEIVCPNCGHKHQRKIRDGLILHQGRFSGSPTQEICPTKGAFSKKPTTQIMRQKSYDNERDGVVVDDFVRSRWLEIHGKKI